MKNPQKTQLGCFFFSLKNQGFFRPCSILLYQYKVQPPGQSSSVDVPSECVGTIYPGQNVHKHSKAIKNILRAKYSFSFRLYFETLKLPQSNSKLKINQCLITTFYVKTRIRYSCISKIMVYGGKQENEKIA